MCVGVLSSYLKHLGLPLAGSTGLAAYWDLGVFRNVDWVRWTNAFGLVMSTSADPLRLIYLCHKAKFVLCVCVRVRVHARP